MSSAEINDLADDLHDLRASMRAVTTRIRELAPDEIALEAVRISVRENHWYQASETRETIKFLDSTTFSRHELEAALDRLVELGLDASSTTLCHYAQAAQETNRTIPGAIDAALALTRDRDEVRKLSAKIERTREQIDRLEGETT